MSMREKDLFERMKAYCKPQCRAIDASRLPVCVCEFLKSDSKAQAGSDFFTVRNVVISGEPLSGQGNSHTFLTWSGSGVAGQENNPGWSRTTIFRILTGSILDDLSSPPGFVAVRRRPPEKRLA